MYFLLGISLTFAFLLILNAATAISATALWHIVAIYADKNWSARRRAGFIFALRVFPVAVALLFVSAFVLPAYFLFEPHSSDETIGFNLAAVAGISAVGVVIAFYRIFGTWRATRRLVRNWLKHAEPIEIEGVSIPVYRIQHTFPVIAVVGMFRPQMFVARQIFDSLNAEEFQAAIAHETGHVAARDNFKRTLLRVCRDLLVFPFGRVLDRAWTTNAESGADEYAARRGGNSAAINLAAALIKIARIVPEGAKPSMPAGAFLIQAQTAEVACRVRKLLQITERANLPAKSDGAKVPLRLLSGLCFLIVLALAADRDFLRRIHDALEAVVALLQ